MTKTPLEAAESQFRSISITEKNGQFAAIRKVLEERERKLRLVQKAARLQNRMLPDGSA